MSATDESAATVHFRVRPAEPADAPTLVALINELAAYERLSHESRPDAAALALHLAEARCEALVAEHDADGTPLGFALYFQHYSTFLTRWGLYLEDLYVRPDWRGRGVGFALLRAVARAAAERGCERMEWAVLDWNEPAIAFYQRLGAVAMSDWTTMRLSGDAIRRLA